MNSSDVVLSHTDKQNDIRALPHDPDQDHIRHCSCLLLRAEHETDTMVSFRDSHQLAFLTWTRQHRTTTSHQPPALVLLTLLPQSVSSAPSLPSSRVLLCRSCIRLFVPLSDFSALSSE